MAAIRIEPTRGVTFNTAATRNAHRGGCGRRVAKYSKGRKILRRNLEGEKVNERNLKHRVTLPVTQLTQPAALRERMEGMGIDHGRKIFPNLELDLTSRIS